MTDAQHNARAVRRWRKRAAAWRTENPDLAGGFVTIFRGKAVGWLLAFEHSPAKNFEPCVIAVPAESGAPCFITMGGDAINGADRWEEVKL